MKPLQKLFATTILVAIGCGSTPLLADDSRLPIVFVPGTGGSQLLVQGAKGGQEQEVYWISPGLLKDDRAKLGLAGLDETSDLPPGTRVVASKVLKSVPMQARITLSIEMEGDPNPFQSNIGGVHPLDYPVYGNFEVYAREVLAGSRQGYQEVPYDWRKGACDDNAAAIHAVVKQALDATKQKQVILVGHSLGGLVCRDYIARDYARGKVKALIAVGTPWLGAPKAARGLRWGYNFGLGYLFEPLGDYRLRRMYLYAQRPDRSFDRLDYLTNLSLLNPEVSKRLASRFPSVYQQLPTYQFMRLYGKASKPASDGTSIFFEHATPEKTIQDFEKLGGALYKDAMSWREKHLNNSESYGVQHILIAATCAPKAPRDYQTDMRMARSADLSKIRPEELVDDIKGSWEKTKAFGTALTSAGFGIATKPDDLRRIADQFFDINPFFRDLGNLALINNRDEAFRQLRTTQNLPLYLDDYLAVDHSETWGDSTSPLLSASAGALLQGVPNTDITQAKLDLKTAEKLLGKGVKVFPTELKPLFDHSNMLDDPGVKAKLAEIIDALNEEPKAP